MNGRISSALGRVGSLSAVNPVNEVESVNHGLALNRAYNLGTHSIMLRHLCGCLVGRDLGVLGRKLMVWGGGRLIAS